MISLQTCIIIFIIVVAILFYKIYELENKLNEATNEKLTNTSIVSNEALQTLGSVFNSGTLTVKNLNVTGNANVTGTTTLTNTQINGNTTGIGSAIFDSLTTLKNAQINGDITTGKLTASSDVMTTGKLTVNGGSDFSGPSHLFRDDDNKGTVRIGSVYDNAGITATDGKPLQIQDFSVGIQAVTNPSNPATQYMTDKNYCYLKSRLPSYAIINNKTSGHFAMYWSSGDLGLVSTYLQNGARYNNEYTNFRPD